MLIDADAGGCAGRAAARAPARPDRWLLLAPLAIYAGWLTAATGVSIGVLLTGFGWLSDTGAALLMLALVLAVALTIQRPPAPRARIRPHGHLGAGRGLHPHGTGTFRSRPACHTGLAASAGANAPAVCRPRGLRIAKNLATR